MSITFSDVLQKCEPLELETMRCRLAARKDLINAAEDERYLNILKIQYQRYIIHEKKRSIGFVTFCKSYGHKAGQNLCYWCVSK